MVYWLVLRLIPLRELLVICAIIAIATMLGVDLVTPLVDWVTGLLTDSFGNLL